MVVETLHQTQCCIQWLRLDNDHGASKGCCCSCRQAGYPFRSRSPKPPLRCKHIHGYICMQRARHAGTQSPLTCSAHDTRARNPHYLHSAWILFLQQRSNGVRCRHYPKVPCIVHRLWTAEEEGRCAVTCIEPRLADVKRRRPGVIATVWVAKGADCMYMQKSRACHRIARGVLLVSACCTVKRHGSKIQTIKYKMHCGDNITDTRQHHAHLLHTGLRLQRNALQD